MQESILTCNSINYTIDTLFNIANPSKNLKYDIDYKPNDNKVTLSFKNSKKKINFHIVPDKLWYDLVYEETKIKWFNRSDIKFAKNIKFEKIPVLFHRNGRESFVDILNENELVFNADIISSSFFMLSRWEEIINKNRDNHGRFYAKESVAYKYGFLDLPVVDIYRMILRECLQILFPSVDLGKNEFSVILSHDIDHIRRFSNFKSILRTIIGGDLIIRRSITMALSSMKKAVQSFKNIENDPYFKGIYVLAQVSKKFNLRSAFYFKTCEKGNYDSGYSIDASLKQCIEELKSNGLEVGFHPGYETFKDYNTFIKEKEIMDNILQTKKYGGRQHYLRFDILSTWRYWEKAGLTYDSSMGYADCEGFRCGTSHIFRPFDIEYDRELNIFEIPLIVMETTLEDERNLSPEEGLESIINLAQCCQKVEGNFTLLWHNTSVYGAWKQWFDIYIKAIKQLSGYNAL